MRSTFLTALVIFSFHALVQSSNEHSYRRVHDNSEYDVLKRKTCIGNEVEGCKEESIIWEGTSAISSRTNWDAITNFTEAVEDRSKGKLRLRRDTEASNKNSAEAEERKKLNGITSELKLRTSSAEKEVSKLLAEDFKLEIPPAQQKLSEIIGASLKEKDEEENEKKSEKERKVTQTKENFLKTTEKPFKETPESGRGKDEEKLISPPNERLGVEFPYHEQPEKKPEVYGGTPQTEDHLTDSAVKQGKQFLKEGFKGKQISHQKENEEQQFDTVLKPNETPTNSKITPEVEYSEKYQHATQEQFKKSGRGRDEGKLLSFEETSSENGQVVAEFGTDFEGEKMPSEEELTPVGVNENFGRALGPNEKKNRLKEGATEKTPLRGMKNTVANALKKKPFSTPIAKIGDFIVDKLQTSKPPHEGKYTPDIEDISKKEPEENHLEGMNDTLKKKLKERPTPYQKGDEQVPLTKHSEPEESQKDYKGTTEAQFPPFDPHLKAKPSSSPNLNLHDGVPKIGKPENGSGDYGLAPEAEHPLTDKPSEGKKGTSEGHFKGKPPSSPKDKLHANVPKIGRAEEGPDGYEWTPETEHTLIDKPLKGKKDTLKGHMKRKPSSAPKTKLYSDVSKIGRPGQGPDDYEWTPETERPLILKPLKGKKDPLKGHFKGKPSSSPKDKLHDGVPEFGKPEEGPGDYELSPEAEHPLTDKPSEGKKGTSEGHFKGKPPSSPKDKLHANVPKIGRAEGGPDGYEWTPETEHTLIDKRLKGKKDTLKGHMKRKPSSAPKTKLYSDVSKIGRPGQGPDDYEWTPETEHTLIDKPLKGKKDTLKGHMKRKPSSAPKTKLYSDVSKIGRPGQGPDDYEWTPETERPLILKPLKGKKDPLKGHFKGKPSSSPKLHDGVPEFGKPEEGPDDYEWTPETKYPLIDKPLKGKKDPLKRHFKGKLSSSLENKLHDDSLKFREPEERPGDYGLVPVGGRHLLPPPWKGKKEPLKVLSLPIFKLHDGISKIGKPEEGPDDYEWTPETEYPLSDKPWKGKKEPWKGHLKGKPLPSPNFNLQDDVPKTGRPGEGPGDYELSPEAEHPLIDKPWKGKKEPWKGHLKGKPLPSPNFNLQDGVPKTGRPGEGPGDYELSPEAEHPLIDKPWKGKKEPWKGHLKGKPLPSPNFNLQDGVPKTGRPGEGPEDYEWTPETEYPLTDKPWKKKKHPLDVHMIGKPSSSPTQNLHDHVPKFEDPYEDRGDNGWPPKGKHPLVGTPLKESKPSLKKVLKRKPMPSDEGKVGVELPKYAEPEESPENYGWTPEREEPVADSGVKGITQLLNEEVKGKPTPPPKEGPGVELSHYEQPEKKPEVYGGTPEAEDKLSDSAVKQIKQLLKEELKGKPTPSPNEGPGVELPHYEQPEKKPEVYGGTPEAEDHLTDSAVKQIKQLLKEELKGKPTPSPNEGPGVELPHYEQPEKKPEVYGGTPEAEDHLTDSAAKQIKQLLKEELKGKSISDNKENIEQFGRSLKPKKTPTYSEITPEVEYSERYQHATEEQFKETPESGRGRDEEILLSFEETSSENGQVVPEFGTDFEGEKMPSEEELTPVGVNENFGRALGPNEKKNRLKEGATEKTPLKEMKNIVAKVLKKKPFSTPIAKVEDFVVKELESSKPPYEGKYTPEIEDISKKEPEENHLEGMNDTLKKKLKERPTPYQKGDEQVPLTKHSEPEESRKYYKGMPKAELPPLDKPWKRKDAPMKGKLEGKPTPPRKDKGEQLIRNYEESEENAEDYEWTPETERPVPHTTLKQMKGLMKEQLKRKPTPPHKKKEKVEYAEYEGPEESTEDYEWAPETERPVSQITLKQMKEQLKRKPIPPHKKKEKVEYAEYEGPEESTEDYEWAPETERPVPHITLKQMKEQLKRKPTPPHKKKEKVEYAEYEGPEESTEDYEWAPETERPVSQITLKQMKEQLKRKPIPPHKKKEKVEYAEYEGPEESTEDYEWTPETERPVPHITLKQMKGLMKELLKRKPIPPHKKKEKVEYAEYEGPEESTEDYDWAPETERPVPHITLKQMKSLMKELLKRKPIPPHEKKEKVEYAEYEGPEESTEDYEWAPETERPVPHITLKQMKGLMKELLKRKPIPPHKKKEKVEYAEYEGPEESTEDYGWTPETERPLSDSEVKQIKELLKAELKGKPTPPSKKGARIEFPYYEQPEESPDDYKWIPETEHPVIDKPWRAWKGKKDPLDGHLKGKPSSSPKRKLHDHVPKFEDPYKDRDDYGWTPKGEHPLVGTPLRQSKPSLKKVLKRKPMPSDKGKVGVQLPKYAEPEESPENYRWKPQKNEPLSDSEVKQIKQLLKKELKGKRTPPPKEEARVEFPYYEQLEESPDYYGWTPETEHLLNKPWIPIKDPRKEKFKRNQIIQALGPKGSLALSLTGDEGDIKFTSGDEFLRPENPFSSHSLDVDKKFGRTLERSENVDEDDDEPENADDDESENEDDDESENEDDDESENEDGDEPENEDGEKFWSDLEPSSDDVEKEFGQDLEPLEDGNEDGENYPGVFPAETKLFVKTLRETVALKDMFYVPENGEKRKRTKSLENEPSEDGEDEDEEENLPEYSKIPKYDKILKKLIKAQKKTTY